MTTGLVAAPNRGRGIPWSGEVQSPLTQRSGLSHPHARQVLKHTKTNKTNNTKQNTSAMGTPLKWSQVRSLHTECIRR